MDELPSILASLRRQENNPLSYDSLKDRGGNSSWKAKDLVRRSVGLGTSGSGSDRQTKLDGPNASSYGGNTGRRRPRASIGGPHSPSRSASTSSLRRSTGSPAPPFAGRYLDQPDIVAEILAATTPGPSPAPGLPPASRSPGIGPSPGSETTAAAAPPLQQPARRKSSPALAAVPKQTGTNLPTLSSLSPRTVRKIQRLPPPNEIETKRLAEIDQHMAGVDSSAIVELRKSGGMYDTLHASASRIASQKTQLWEANANHKPLAAYEKVASAALQDQAVKVDYGTEKFFTSEDLEKKQPKPKVKQVRKIPETTLEDEAQKRVDEREKAHANLEEIRAQVAQTDEEVRATQAGEAAVADSLKDLLPDELLFQDNMKSVRIGKAMDRVVHALEKQAFLKMQWGIQTWHSQAQKLSVLREAWAARVLQRSVRKRQANQEIEERKHVLENQKWREQKHLNARIAVRLKAMLEIQRVYRGHLGRLDAHQARAEIKAAEYIQIVTRAHFVHEARRKRIERERLREFSATQIQRTFRGRLGRVRFEVIRKIRTVAGIEHFAKYYHDRLHQDFQLHGAAMRIQLLWKRNMYWKNLRNFIRFQKQMRAIIMQRWVRRFNAVMERRRRYKAKIEREELELKSAIYLEAFIRMALAMKLKERLRFERDAQECVRKLEKKTALTERYWRLPLGLKGPPLAKKGEPMRIHISGIIRYKNESKRAGNLLQFRRDMAASITIQKLYRRYLVRRKVMWVRQLQRDMARHEKERKELKAAINIERIYRGYRGRVAASYIAHTYNQITVAKIYRGFAARKKVFELKKYHAASVTMQRYWRGFVKRRAFKQFQQLNRERQKPALLVQRVMRGIIVRREHRALRMNRRRDAEIKLFALKSFEFCRHRVRSMLVLESAYGKHSDVGEIQSIFLHYAGGGAAAAHKEDAAAHADRMLVSGFVKFFKETPNVLGREMTVSDLEIMFTKYKTQGEKHLSYLQFALALDMVNATLFEDVTKYENAHGKRARMLKLINEHVFKARWAKPYIKALSERTDVYVARKAAWIQSVIRGFFGRIEYRTRLEIHRTELATQRRLASAVRLQCAARKYFARCLVVTLAKKILVKYIEPASGEPYWSNPRTRRVVWTKPTLFGSSDIEVPTVLPHKGTEYLISCVNCLTSTAQSICYECDDVFCNSCFSALHTKGNRKKHTQNPIPHCVVCHYQMASRVCGTCTAQKRFTFMTCDVCHKNVHADVKRPHKWTWLTMPCVECHEYAARWRCLDCNDLYCTECFSHVHSRGAKVHHEYEKLNYYTHTLHEHFMRDAREEARRKRDEEKLAQLRSSAPAVQHDKALVLQRMYRGMLGRIEGKLYLKQERHKVRNAWKLRQKENLKRRRYVYQLRDIFGFAKMLESDLLEEQVLQRVPIWKRPRARYFIQQNLADEAHFAHLERDVKKTPRSQFRIGTVEQLIKQARYGGVRLPGLISIEEGSREVHTTLDLSSLLKKGDRVRIKHWCFFVNGEGTDLVLGKETVPLARVWRLDDVKDEPMFLMPPSGLMIHLGRIFYYGFLNAQVAQLLIGGRIAFHSSSKDLVNVLAKGLRKIGNRKAANYLKGRSKKHEKWARRIKYGTGEYIKNAGVKAKENVEEVSVEAMQAKKDDAKNNSYLDQEEVGKSKWEEKYDEERCKTYWVHVDTGEVVFEKPAKELDEMTQAEKDVIAAKKRIAQRKAVQGKKTVGGRKKKL